MAVAEVFHAEKTDKNLFFCRPDHGSSPKFKHYLLTDTGTTHGICIRGKWSVQEKNISFETAWGNFIKRFYKKLNSGEDISFGMTEGIQ